jgi:micrococcal nuclease
MITDTYIRNGEIIRVLDGDTIEVKVDLGCDISISMMCRLAGINAPEHDTPEGVKAKLWLQAALPATQPVVIQTTKDKKEKYGRYLATVYLKDTNINEKLVSEGLAVSYHGEARPAPVKKPVVKKVAVKKA